MSPFRRRKPPPATSSPPITPPKINLRIRLEEEEAKKENDMTTAAWSYDCASRSPTSKPKPIIEMYHTSPRPSGPSPVDPFTTNSTTLSSTNTLTSPDGSIGPSAWRTNPHSLPQNSKTSQYIDKITSENERLRRELKAEKLAREEETKRLSAEKSKAEDSRTEYQTLQVLADANARAIERKDRKLEELKTALEAETRRRVAAEQREGEMSRVLGETRSDTQRQLAKALELQHMAETNSDAARDGFKRITDSYERKMKSITKDLADMKRQQKEDADQIRRQVVVSEQLAHEASKRTRTEGQMKDLLGTYKREFERGMDDLLAEAEHLRVAVPEKEAEAAKLCLLLKETTDKMKWVMAQNKRQER